MLNSSVNLIITMTTSQHNQFPGEEFRLLPNEKLLMEVSLQKCTVPVISTCIRLTDKRLVFSDVSRWLSVGVSWLFLFMKPTTVSLSLRKSEIVSMELASTIGRKNLLIKTKTGDLVPIASMWFSNTAVTRIMQWWKEEDRA